MKYTIEESAPGRWVASDGTAHVEADDPVEAIFRLSAGSIEAEDGSESVDDFASFCEAEEHEHAIGRSVLTLIRMCALRHPASHLRFVLETMAKRLELFITEADLEK